MRKEDLEQGMLVQTTHNRYGFVELDRNRIDFCYDPDVLKDEYAHLEKVSLDDVFEFGDGQLGIGFIVTEENKGHYPMCKVGEVCICYEIVAAYVFNKVYANDEGVYPPLKLPEDNFECADTQYCHRNCTNNVPCRGCCSHCLNHNTKTCSACIYKRNGI